MNNALAPDLLLESYAAGIFAMGMPDGAIGWFCPDPRGIIPLDRFHIPRGLRRTLKKPDWELRTDTAFDAVLDGCASRAETWITPEIRANYRSLFQSGHAHSVEVWKDGALAGGLYGVAVGGAFFGESMFHRVPDASKVALCHLVAILKRGGFLLLDTQWTTPHLRQFGAVEIPREEYLLQLRAAIARNASFAGTGISF
jgi:leucyl/phenylalanyl-tRNA---protein transferase